MGAVACGPAIAVPDHEGTSGGHDTVTEPTPMFTTGSSSDTTTGEASTGTAEDPCGQLGSGPAGDVETGGGFGGCVLCHEGFLLEFFPVGGRSAAALLPTEDGGFVAVGSTDTPASITWLDAEGNPTAQAGPYADQLYLESGAWTDDGGMVLAGTRAGALWLGIVDASGALLVDRRQELPDGSFLPGVRVVHHPTAGTFASAYMGDLSLDAYSWGLSQFDDELQQQHGFHSPTEPFNVELFTRGTIALTSTDVLYGLIGREDGLSLLRREAAVPPGEAESGFAELGIAGRPADLVALHGDVVVSASNDVNPHIARIDDGDDIAWTWSPSGGSSTRVDRLAFDSIHDLVFVGGVVRLDGGAEHLWLAALDPAGNDVWEWLAPPIPEGPNTPVLDLVELPAGGVAASTFGSLWYVTARPNAC